MSKRSFGSKSRTKSKTKSRNKKLEKGRSGRRKQSRLMAADSLVTPPPNSVTPPTTYEKEPAPQPPLVGTSTPPSKPEELAFVTTISQLTASGSYLTITGGASTEDELEITDASGAIIDDLFTNVSSIEELEIEGNGGFQVTLGPKAQAAGIREVELGGGKDTVDASAMTVGLEIEAGQGDDDLTGGTGNDEIEGGKGADLIDLSAGGSDKVKYESKLDGSTVGLPGGTFTGFDDITGFTSGDDKVDIDYKFAAIKFITAPQGFDFTNVDGVITQLNQAVNSDTYAEGKTVIFALNSETSAAIYSGTVTDRDATTPGIQPMISNPYLLALVNSPLSSGDII